jgi:AcrR family transcriptional regulator
MTNPQHITSAAPALAGDTARLALQCLDDLARQKGLEDVSMRDVARALGISLAALQYHYPSKSALFDAFVQHSVDTYQQRIARIASESEPPTRFINMLDFVARETLAVAQGGVLAMIEARAHHDEASHQAMQRFMRSYLEGMGSIVAAEFPELPPDEVQLCAILVCSQFEGLASTYEAAREAGANPTKLLEASVETAVLIVTQRAASVLNAGDQQPAGLTP